MRARQFDEAVSQIFPLQEDEDDENCGDAGGCERAKQRRNQRRDALERSRRRLANLDRYRFSFLARWRSLRWRIETCWGILRFVQFLAEILKHICGTFEGPARRCRTTKRLDLFMHVPHIGRTVAARA